MKLSLADSRYEKILQSIYDAVFITDDQGLILEVNDRALEAFQTTLPQVRGVSVFRFFSGANPSLLSTILHNLQEHRYTVIEARCVRSDETIFQGEIAVNRIPHGNKCELCFLVRDISVRHKAQQDLHHALERMEAISRARMEFVSNVSHELRTPLTSMIYAVKNMQNGHAGILNERAMQYLSRLDSDCKRLLATVNDILDLRQIENNTLVLSKTRSALRSIVESAADTLRVQADAKGLRMPVRMAAQTDFVNCDLRKMERVFINVIGNAVKFTPSGGEIAIAVGRSTAFPEMAAVSVSDSGIGIPPDQIEKVTARYYQVGEQVNGTGLGLSISKELVELHGGKLQIESPVPGMDKGTRVTIALPLEEAPETLLLVRGGEPGDELRQELQKHGLPFTHLTSGHQAIRRAIEKTPNLLLLGNETEDLSVCDVAIQFRNDRRLSRIPILFVAEEDTSRNAVTIMQAFKIPILARKDVSSSFLAHFCTHVNG